MKNLSQLFSLLFFASILIFSGCKKDRNAPVITLLGDDNIELPLLGSYQEPGFTAADEEDGDLTSEVTVTGTVDESKIGTYTLTYTVMDEAGNAATINRTIQIKIMQENWVGSFTVGDNCTGIIAIADDQTVSSGGSATELSITPIFDVFGGTMEASISGQNITIPSQDVAGTDVSGSGTINDNATIIVLNMSFDPLLGGVQTCTLTYSRK